MKLSKRIKVWLFTLIVLINILLRYPTTPHEIGVDSFVIHILANSISAFGQANWWANPLSIVGMMPYSESSAVPFILSGLSNTTSMTVEKGILIYSLVLGVFSVFVSYLMAGAIWDNDYFKFLVAFVFSTSQGIVTYTTWTAPTRTLFVTTLPLFIYLILGTRKFKIRFGILSIVFFILLLTTHKLVFFVFPIVFSYLGLVIIYRLKNHFEDIGISENLIGISMLASFLIMLFIPFQVRTIMQAVPRGYEGSRYLFLISTFLVGYVRYVGVLIVLVGGGLTYLSFKREKTFEEWFLLLSSLSLTPLLYLVTYTKWLIATFSSFFIGIALINISNPNKKSRHASLFLILFLISSVMFTGYFQFLHTYNNPFERHMEERTYAAGLWINDNINRNMIGNNKLTVERIFAISEVSTLIGAGAQDTSYGFTNLYELDITKNSPSQISFYLNGAYERTPHTLDTSYYFNKINMVEVDSPKGKEIISKFNLAVIVEVRNNKPNTFIKSIYKNKNNLYDNGKIGIWEL